MNESELDRCDRCPQKGRLIADMKEFEAEVDRAATTPCFGLRVFHKDLSGRTRKAVIISVISETCCNLATEDEVLWPAVSLGDEPGQFQFCVCHG